MLNDMDIRTTMVHGRHLVEPYDPLLVQPNSIDMRLAGEVSVMEKAGFMGDPIIDLARRRTNGLNWRTIGKDEDIIIPSHGFALASTIETVCLPSDLSAHVEGKSSLARLGLMVHVTAGFIDAGFHGRITLELANLTPAVMRLTAGMPVCQLAFHRLSGPAEHPYGSDGLGSHYQNQTGTTMARGEKTMIGEVSE